MRNHGSGYIENPFEERTFAKKKKENSLRNFSRVKNLAEKQRRFNFPWTRMLASYWIRQLIPGLLCGINPPIQSRSITVRI